MVITLRQNTFQPVSLLDLHQVKRNYFSELNRRAIASSAYLKQYSPYLVKVGKFLKTQFKNTAFYDFFLIASINPDE